jgi:hypothetical protein
MLNYRQFYRPEKLENRNVHSVWRVSRTWIALDLPFRQSFVATSATLFATPLSALLSASRKSLRCPLFCPPQPSPPCRVESSQNKTSRLTAPLPITTVPQLTEKDFDDSDSLRVFYSLTQDMQLTHRSFAIHVPDKTSYLCGIRPEVPYYPSSDLLEGFFLARRPFRWKTARELFNQTTT